MFMVMPRIVPLTASPPPFVHCLEFIEVDQPVFVLIEFLQCQREVSRKNRRGVVHRLQQLHELQLVDGPRVVVVILLEADCAEREGHRLNELTFVDDLWCIVYIHIYLSLSIAFALSSWKRVWCNMYMQRLLLSPSSCCLTHTVQWENGSADE